MYSVDLCCDTLLLKGYLFLQRKFNTNTVIISRKAYALFHNILRGRKIWRRFADRLFQLFNVSLQGANIAKSILFVLFELVEVGEDFLRCAFLKS